MGKGFSLILLFLSGESVAEDVLVSRHLELVYPVEAVFIAEVAGVVHSVTAEVAVYAALAVIPRPAAVDGEAEHLLLARLDVHIAELFRGARVKEVYVSVEGRIVAVDQLCAGGVYPHRRLTEVLDLYGYRRAAAV